MDEIEDRQKFLRKIDSQCQEAAMVCSRWVGEVLWVNDWACPRRYHARLLNLNDFNILVEDVEDSESDPNGFATFTTRHIKVFVDTTLIFHAYSKIQGLDEYDGGGAVDSRVEFVRDGWHIDRAAYKDNGISDILALIMNRLGRGNN